MSNTTSAKGRRTRPPRRDAARTPVPTAHGSAVGFWMVASGFAIIVGFSAVPTPLYGLYAARDGFGPLMITVVYATYVIGVAAGLLGAGHISDWYGRRRVLIPALATAAISAVLFLVWRDLPGLMVARLVGGLAVGVTGSTATAWLSELHAARHPEANSRRAEIVATVFNFGGIGVGALIAGILAQWVRMPLTVPYLVFLTLMAAAVVALALTPETSIVAAADRPPYRPQRMRAPAHGRGRFYAALTGAFISTAAIGFFTSLAPSFLAGPFGQPSVALAGTLVLVVAAAAAIAPITLVRARQGIQAGIGAASMSAGTVAIVIAVELPSPSLWLFLCGGALIGIGGGTYFRSALTGALALSDRSSRAGTLASVYLASYVGQAVPVVGLGVLMQNIAAGTSLLIFGVLLIAGVAASARPMIHGHEGSGPQRAPAGKGK